MYLHLKEVKPSVVSIEKEVAIEKQQQQGIGHCDAEQKYLRCLRSQSVAELNLFSAARAVALGEAKEGIADEAVAKLIKMKKETRSAKRQLKKEKKATTSNQEEKTFSSQHDIRSDEETVSRSIETLNERSKEESSGESYDGSYPDTPGIQMISPSLEDESSDAQNDPYLVAEDLYRKALVHQLNADLKLHFLARAGAAEDKNQRKVLKECIALFISRRNEASRLKSELTEVKMAQLVAEKMAQAREDFHFVFGDEASVTTHNTSKRAWRYFKTVCSIVINRWTYEQSFSAVEKDSLYSYLMSCSYNDEPDKPMYQQRSSYDGDQLCDATELVEKAKEALPKFVEICKDIARKLGLREVGVGPIKTACAAITKAEKKYHGDVSKVTDFCRGFLVAKDVSTLLAIIELTLSSCGDDVKRIKLSTLRQGDNALEGGYRDCKINIVVDGHICEIQLHLENYWKVAKVDGYQVYKKCLEESTTNSFNDPFRSLIGLNDGQLDDLIGAAAEDGIQSQSWHRFKVGRNIKAYFALAGLLLQAEEEQEAKAIQGKIYGLKLRTRDTEAMSLDIMYSYLQKKVHIATGGWTQEDILWMTPNELTKTFHTVTSCTDFEQDEEQIHLAKETWLKKRILRFEALSMCDPADKALVELAEGTSDHASM